LKLIAISVTLLVCPAYGSIKADPGTVFTRREVVDRLGNTVSYENFNIDFDADSILEFSEGDSLAVSFFAEDPDSPDMELSFALVYWSDFIRRRGSRLDSLALVDTSTIIRNGIARGFRVRLQLAFNVGDISGGEAKALIVSAFDGTSHVYDTMLFRVGNLNRAPIWDADTSSRPSDSALVWSFDPGALEPESIQDFLPLRVKNNATDTLELSRYVYDPDPLIGDSLGWPLTFTQSGAPADLFDSNGLMVISLSVPDTITYPFQATVADSDPEDPKPAAVSLGLRVVPEPDIDQIYPPMAAPGEVITIYGSGFGLFDVNALSPSRVLFRARNPAGAAQNIPAAVNSWSPDRINLTIPMNVPVTKFDTINHYPIPDTIIVYSSVSPEPGYYPYIVTTPDTMTISDLEVVNLTPTSAAIQWKTAYTGADSVILAINSDTLDVFSTNFPAPAAAGGYWPRFVLKIVPGPGLTTIPATVLRQRGKTSAADRIHYVKLTDLNPETTYNFIIGTAGIIFYGDSLHNVNGPWFPAKIDRSNAVAADGEMVNAAISAFRLRTPPAQSTTSESFTLFGKVFTTGGAAANALVTVKIVDSANVADTSLGLTAVVRPDSTWVINLGNAMSDTIGVAERVFRHKAGDFLLITVLGDNGAGYKQFVEVRADSSPQIIGGGGILLGPVVGYDIYLEVGLNLIGLPVELLPDEPRTAEALLDKLIGGKPSISRYNSATGNLERTIRSFTAAGLGYSGYPDFSLELYRGYFVYVDAASYLNLQGAVIGKELPPVVFPSAALYWISRPAQEVSSPTAKAATREKESRATLPRAFMLGQNFPNPFNPATTISYSVPEGPAVHVTLKVYDIRGNLVRILVDEVREAGAYSVSWEATDRAGRQVSSGVYLYRLQAGDFLQTRKMVLLK